MAILRIEGKKGILNQVLHLKCNKELIKGLMFKKKGNALLEFKKPGNYKIWMLFMRYPLVLYFINEKLRIIDKKYATPLTFAPKTWKLYYSKNKYKYVLEVDKREKTNFEIGEKIKITFEK